MNADLVKCGQEEQSRAGMACLGLICLRRPTVGLSIRAPTPGSSKIQIQPICGYDWCVWCERLKSESLISALRAMTFEGISGVEINGTKEGR